MSICYVIPTLGRRDEIDAVIQSILKQSVPNPSIVIVDQNAEPFLRPIVARYADRIPITHLEVGAPLGSSGARNAGWRATEAEFVLFADDDCWYPDDLVARMIATLEKRGADLVAGRCADAEGRNVNGNFQTHAGWVGQANIWTTQIEWMLLFRRAVLEATGGFDPKVGVGCYYGSCEGQDISLRALATGARLYYDPALYGHHPNVLLTPGPATALKCRRYGRGMGYVLRTFGYSPLVKAKYLVRPLLRAAWSLARLKPRTANLSLQTALGRLEGMRAPAREAGARPPEPA